jgi:hypothetical protein
MNCYDWRIMAHEYEGLETQYLIRDAENEAEHYEEQAEQCLLGIFKGFENAYALALHFAARVSSYQILIERLKLGIQK